MCYSISNDRIALLSFGKPAGKRSCPSWQCSTQDQLPFPYSSSQVKHAAESISYEQLTFQMSQPTNQRFLPSSQSQMSQPTNQRFLPSSQSQMSQSTRQRTLGRSRLVCH